MIGKVLGGYRLLRKIGEGGMGAVYEAVHLALGRRAAVKCLLPELSNDLEACRRFFLEARTATASNHPGLVEIYGSGHGPDGVGYIAMEFLDGEPLGAALRRCGHLDVAWASSVTHQVALAVGAVHEKGVVHRDLKPDNLFLLPQGRVKVLDFGIAKLSEPDAQSTKTKTGIVLGTPSYMSPEQCRGHGRVDARSDIYSLGCILHEMLTGRPPFKSTGFGECLAQHIYEPPTPLRRIDHSIPEDVEKLVLSMLVKSPDARIQTMAAVATSLEALMPRLAASVVTTQPAPRAPSVPPPTTTLRSAAGEAKEQTTRLRSRPLFGGLVAVALLAIGVGVLTRQHGAEIPSSPDAAVSWPDAPAPDATAPDAPAPEAPPPPEIATCGVLPVPGDAVHVVIRSNPSGATVTIAGTRLGTTPFELDMAPCRGGFVATVRRSGFQGRELRFAGDEDSAAAVTLPIGAIPNPK